MWVIQDHYVPQIAEEFYDNLINYDIGHDGRKALSSSNAAHELHYAIQFRKTEGDSDKSLGLGSIRTLWSLVLSFFPIVARFESESRLVNPQTLIVVPLHSDVRQFRDRRRA